MPTPSVRTCPSVRDTGNLGVRLARRERGFGIIGRVEDDNDYLRGMGTFMAFDTARNHRIEKMAGDGPSPRSSSATRMVATSG